ncbi:MFS transporter [Levilactobacillus brevis]|uniref:MFS transporter n=1 Tax=Levilactobacillus brevis TaxID=1580 RepID=UPI0005B61FEE|nr:MFS transporter [Levilactobacillus brevis]KIR08452.1 MFS transporter [Levilactobacillus brevis]
MEKVKHQWLALVAIGLFTIMANLDSSIVNIALPILSKDFDIPTSAASYTVIIYMVVLSGLLIVGGRLGDMISKTRIFKIGMYVFTVGSILASINFGFKFLLFARVVQAIGAAATLSNSYGLISKIFTKETVGKAMGFNTMFISAGFIAGPAIGGMLLQHFIWNSIFMINIPLGIIAIIMAQLYLPNENAGKVSTNFDWLGSILLFAIISLLIVGLETGQNLGFANLNVLILFGILVVIAIIFGLIENHHSEPVLDFKLFGDKKFTLALMAGVMVMMVNSFFDIVFPFYLQNILHWSVGAAGLMMISFPVIMAISAPFGGSLGDKYGRTSIVISGAIFLLVSQLLYITFGFGTSIVMMILATAVNGIGAGLFVSNNNTLVMESVKPHQLGIAGAVQSLLTNIGQVLGIVFANLILYTTMSKDAGRKISTIPTNHPGLFVNGMHVTFIATSLFMVLCLLIYAVRGRIKHLKA